MADRGLTDWAKVKRCNEIRAECHCNGTGVNAGAGKGDRASFLEFCTDCTPTTSAAVKKLIIIKLRAMDPLPIIASPNY
jgi:hypothetical protein